MNTMEQNFNNVKKDIRALGVKVKVNVMECCRGCIGDEKLNLKSPDQPYIYTYGGQGNAISWIEGRPYWRSEVNGRYSKWIIPNDRYLAPSAYFNHGNLTPELKEQIVDIFTKHGFVLDWDYSDGKCIEVDFDATQWTKDFEVAGTAIMTDYAQC